MTSRRFEGHLAIDRDILAIILDLQTALRLDLYRVENMCPS